MFRACALSWAVTLAIAFTAMPTATQAATPASSPAVTQPQAQSAPTTTPTAHPVRIPVYQGRDPDKIADTDTPITQVIPLDYVSAADMRAMITELVKPDTPIVASNGYLVVTEASSVVKRIVQIINYVDVARPSDNIIVVVPIAPGSAAEAARQINAVFSAQR